MSHISLDIESLGISTDRKNVVVSIGAVRFDPVKLTSPETWIQGGDSFYAVLHMDQQFAKGLKATGDTLRWWMEQAMIARAVFMDKQEDVENVLHRFNKFCLGSEGLWGNPSTFDNMVVRNLYEAFGVEFCIPWYQDFCLRTLRASASTAHRCKWGIEHNALDDAIAQAMSIQLSVRQIRGIKDE